MVLDPLSALSLAGNIIQFVEFGTKLVHGTNEIIKSTEGSLEKHVWLEETTSSLGQLSNDLAIDTQRGPTASHSKKDEELLNLAISCKHDADDLLATLGDLKAQNPGRKWQSFVQALRSVWKESKIKELERRLNDRRRQLGLQLLARQSEQQWSISNLLHDLELGNKRMNLNRTNQLGDLVGVVKSIRESQVDRSHFEELQSNLSRLASISTAAQDLVIEQKILDSLTFKQMKIRHSNIPDAHTKTFEWIFRDPNQPATPSQAKIKFMEWLQELDSDKGCFWVGGKAGSGKSTLMKFLCDHPKTKLALREWAGDKKLVTASFFFWNAGTTMQKSQEGLLQTLVYEIFRKCLELIPIICPERWTSTRQEPWTRSELLQIFDKLKDEDIISTSFCFFIDGLDEYNGYPQDLIETVQVLAVSPNFKICVSSRPWEAFKQSFSHDIDRRLYLQDLTRNDIILYVRNKLEENANFVQAKTEDDRYQDLVLEIVDRAQGVFLWVFLVVRSLLDGLTNADTLKVLQLRLRRLPTDLEEFYMQMLNSVDDVYQTQMAQTFQIALTSQTPLPLLLYSVLDELEDSPKAALKLSIQPQTKSSVASKELKMQKRIDARSRGLLEVSYDTSETLTNGQFLKRVDFLHRTVRDFLKTKKVTELLTRQIGSSFDPYLTLCHLFLAAIKIFPLVISATIDVGLIDDCVQFLLFHAQISEKNTLLSSTEVIEELDRLQQVESTEEGDHLIVPFEASQTQKRELIDLLLRNGANPHENKGGVAVWKDVIFRLPYTDIASEEQSLRIHVIELFLRYGADPNLKYLDTTVWQRRLEDLYKRREMPQYDHLIYPTFLEVKMLLSYGADPNVLV
ncbi:hypothetical protein N431DRAFT_386517, partial [Stipitochalara longipes BDJ]